jgi:hypothetical protein
VLLICRWHTVLDHAGLIYVVMVHMGRIVCVEEVEDVDIREGSALLVSQ